ncbi:hypothetical protein AB9M62_28505 [Bacillales bacterium AN1005]
MGGIYDGGEEALSIYFDRISIEDVKHRIGKCEGISKSMNELLRQDKD